MVQENDRECLQDCGKALDGAYLIAAVFKLIRIWTGTRVTPSYSSIKDEGNERITASGVAKKEILLL